MKGVHRIVWVLVCVSIGTTVLWYNATFTFAEADRIHHEIDPRDTVWVPDDYVTIQQGIDACPRGGVVMVRPGTYPENVSFNGRPVQLIGLEGADSTIIEAPNHSQPGIYFNADEEYVVKGSIRNRTGYILWIMWWSIMPAGWDYMPSAPGCRGILSGTITNRVG